MRHASPVLEIGVIAALKAAQAIGAVNAICWAMQRAIHTTPSDSTCTAITSRLLRAGSIVLARIVETVLDTCSTGRAKISRGAGARKRVNAIRARSAIDTG